MKGDKLYKLALKMALKENADLKEAFYNYMKSALSGYKQSIYEVGRLYYYGSGIIKDKQLAKVWLDVAAFYGIIA